MPAWRAGPLSGVGYGSPRQVALSPLEGSITTGGGMLGFNESPQAAIEPVGSSRVAEGVTSMGRSAPSWRWLAGALLISLALGLALAGAMRGGRSGALPRAGAASTLSGRSSLPFAAQGQISAAVGAEQPAYGISAAGGGLLHTAGPAHALRASFGRSGVLVSARGIHVGLSLGGIGYGSSLRAVGAVAPTASANRVTYAQAGLSAWYANGPLGLEQGFTIPRAPAGHPSGPLTLSIALTGNAR